MPPILSLIPPMPDKYAQREFTFAAETIGALKWASVVKSCPMARREGFGHDGHQLVDPWHCIDMRGRERAG